MIIPDQKKVASMIVQRMSEDGEMSKPKEMAPSEQTSGPDAFQSIAEELVDAMSSKNAVGVLQALKAFLLEHEVSERD